jgi:hypothetical protein
VADLCHQTGGIPGTDLPCLLATLSPDPQTTGAAHFSLIVQAMAMAAQQPAT